MKNWKYKVTKFPDNNEFGDVTFYETKDEAMSSAIFEGTVEKVKDTDIAKLKTIYIASPLFNDTEKKRINKVVQYLRKHGHEVISPMEFTVPNAWDISNKEWAKAVFDHDMECLDKADTVVCIYDGLMSDSGTAWEVGYACAKGKNVIVLVTDSSVKQSLMVINGVDVVAPYYAFEKLFMKYFNGVDSNTLNLAFSCVDDQS